MEPVTKSRTVAFYGNSLLMASLGATLSEQDDLRLEYVDPEGTESASELQALDPDVILFDLTTARLGLMLSLFQALPQTRLIGVDPDGKRLLVLSGRDSKGLEVSDLLQAIRETPAA